MSELTANQIQLLEKVRAESKNRVRRVLERAELSEKQRQLLQLAKRKLEEARIVINLDLREQYRNELVLDSILDIGRLLNAIEIGYFPDGIRSQRLRHRLLNEFKLYGATRDIQVVFSHMRDSERPNYGVLNYQDESAGVAPATYYGWYRLVLDQALKTCSTFTPFDASVVERDQVYAWDDIEGVLATKLDGQYWYEYVLSESEPLVTRGGGHYIEAQVLGGVHLSDVERLYYPAADRLDHNFFAKLERFQLDYGIELVHY